MKTQHLLLPLLATLLCVACTPSREKEIANIRQHEEQLSAIDVNEMDANAAELVDLYSRFASRYSTDSLAPVYLQRAADICINTQQSERGIRLLDSIICQYPGYEDIAGCWFLRGLAFENSEQFDSARAAYTYFVDQYPDHPLAADTRRSIAFLGMSPEEMLEAILQQAENQ